MKIESSASVAEEAPSSAPVAEKKVRFLIIPLQVLCAFFFPPISALLSTIYFLVSYVFLVGVAIAILFFFGYYKQ